MNWHFKKVLGFELGSKLMCTPMVGGGGNQLYLQPEAGGEDRASLPGENGQILQVYIIQYRSRFDGGGGFDYVLSLRTMLADDKGTLCNYV